MPNGEARGILAWLLVWRGLLQRIYGTELTESRSALRAEGATAMTMSKLQSLSGITWRDDDEPVLFDVYEPSEPHLSKRQILLHR
ncbi:hypothetical protein ACSS6W_006530 [Trichoderma asperelloides]